jgi:hypothetical protein
MGVVRRAGLGDGEAAVSEHEAATDHSLIPIPQVGVFLYAGSATVVFLNGLSPAKGEAYAITGAGGTPTAPGSDALVAGDGAEFDGTGWKKVWDADGGFPPAGTRVLVAATVLGFTLQAPLAHPGDSARVGEFAGGTFTPALTTPTAGQTTTVLTGVGAFMQIAYHTSFVVWAPTATPDSLTGGGFTVSSLYYPETDVDDTTIEVNGSEQLAVKDGAIDAAKLASGQEFTSTDKSNLDNNTTHRGSAGGTDHSDVAANNTHRGSAGGTDHSDVAANNTHRGSAGGTDHSDVAANNTHRGSNGLDHSYLEGNLVDVVIAVADTATDDAAITIDVKKLDGTALAKQCQFVLRAATSQYGGELDPNANCVLGSFSKGQAFQSDATDGRWLVQTDGNGQLAAIMSNTMNETVWFSAHTADGGVSVASQGVLVRGCVPDDATWS